MLLSSTVEDNINRFPKTRNREIRSVQMEVDAVTSGIRRRLKGARDKVLYPTTFVHIPDMRLLAGKNFLVAYKEVT